MQAAFGQDLAVVGLDFSSEALTYASDNFGWPGIRLVQGNCEDLPFADSTFDLIAAFEVIEHLERWQDFLVQTSRVLKKGGTLVVSTPNKAYYTESRGSAGPNPYHVHEFELVEFSDALHSVFPHVRMWTQNHAEAILFAPTDPVGIGAEAPGDASPETANFFVAACSHSPIAPNDAYVWVPRAGNVLREREHHVRKLEGELATKEVWLREAVEDRRQLQALHDNTILELERQNSWAAKLDAELASARATVLGLQREAEVRLSWIGRLETRIADLEGEIRLRDGAVDQYRQHVGILESRLEADAERLKEVVHIYSEQINGLESDLTARTAWARSMEADLETRTRHVQLQAAQIAEHEEHLAAQKRALSDREKQIDELRQRQDLAAASKWVRFGQRLGVGPNLNHAADESTGKTDR